MTLKQHRIITGPLFPMALLALALFLSAVFYLIFSPDVQGRVFFFPENNGARIGSERRGIPKRKRTEAQIKVFLDEVLLGPETLALTNTVPRDTRVLNVDVLDRTVYVNMSKALLNTGKELPVSLDEALANLRYNILFNFFRMEEVVFTIEGQQVHAPYYQGPETTE